MLKTIFQQPEARRQLGKILTASLLLSLVLVLLSGLIQSEPRRIITLDEDYYAQGTWSGWPLNYLYQTDIVRPEGNDTQQSVDGILLGYNWLIWTIFVFGAIILIKLAQTVYANTRH